MSSVTAILPVKPWPLAKSRLTLPAERRESLARAFCFDVVEAVRASGMISQLVIVSAERELVAAARSWGAALLVDRPLVEPAAHRLAVETGRRWAATHRPGKPVVVVPADMPALTGQALDEALHEMLRSDMAVVPDKGGTDVTCVSATSPERLRFARADDFAASCAVQGARVVEHVSPRVRCGVDVVADLGDAYRMGVGCWTSRIMLDTVEVSGPGEFGSRRGAVLAEGLESSAAVGAVEACGNGTSLKFETLLEGKVQ